MMKNSSREKILNQPSYWIEGINGHLYDAIFNYMEKNGLNRTKLADHLGISKGRVSQILNDGEINFSIEKIVEIALKVDVFPVFEFVNKQLFLQNEHMKEPVINPSHFIKPKKPNKHNKPKENDIYHLHDKLISK